MDKGTDQNLSIGSVADLGQAIRLRRKELGLTQGELAAVAGTSLRYVSEVERGKETAQIAGAMRLLAALGMDIELVPR